LNKPIVNYYVFIVIKAAEFKSEYGKSHTNSLKKNNLFL